MSEQKNQETGKWWLELLFLLLLLGLLLLSEERPFWLKGLLFLLEWLFFLLKGLFFLLFAVFMRTPDPKIITAKSGQNVTLTCRAPNNNNISVKWNRDDLGDEYVLLYQDGKFVTDEQHPSFKNRVDLQDRQMKDGDVSLILNNVTTNDTGTYECGVFIEETRLWKNSIIIHLYVDPPVKRFMSRRTVRVAVKRFRRRRTVRVADKNITAESGQDVTLKCRAPNNNITVVEWSRTDLRDEYVLVYRDGQCLIHHQHPSFKNRVDLQDRQMKDGDVSLILKDVTINDTGTYECGVVLIGTKHLNITSIIHLTVDPPGHTGGHKDGGQKIITAESGQDVTLTCRALNSNIIVVVWSRADLGDEFVFVYRDGQFTPDDQHPSFKNRVDLQDRQMKDGDVSLILKDVTINDAGTYKCGVVQRVGGPLTLINSTYLHVDPPGQTGGSVGLIVGLSVPVVLLLLVAVVGFLIYRKKKLNPADPHVAEHLQPECQKTITAESGQDVTLTCRAPDNNIRVVKWIRADLGDEYVLLYQDEQFDPKGQHPSFKNRVDLQDRQMKDGDVSLILKDVTINDAGTYECGVVQGVGGPVTLISSINLVIDPPGQNNITVETSL